MLPTELTRLKRWVAVVNGAHVKHNLVRASPTNPKDWISYETSLKIASANNGKVAFTLFNEDGFTIIDLDNKDSNSSYERTKLHLRIIEKFDSYTEISSSGKGFHIIVKGTLPQNFVNKDKGIEAYSHSKFITITGNIHNGLFEINENQTLLDKFYKDFNVRIQLDADYASGEETSSDNEILDKASNASNGKKFIALMAGEWASFAYTSQSDADFALLSMLCFYTKNDEQVIRLFKRSGLGKRAKATEKYIMRGVTRIRANAQAEDNELDIIVANLPDVNDLIPKTQTNLLQEQIDKVKDEPVKETPPKQKLKEEVVKETPPKQTVKEEVKNKVTDKEFLELPQNSGLLGRINAYVLKNSVKPLKEVSQAVSLAFVAGVVGRAYNVSGLGLNLYMMLLAKSGVGKGGISDGMDNLAALIKPYYGDVRRFIGPGHYASGQALLRYVDSHNCYTSVLNEASITLQSISNPNAPSHEVLFRKVILDIYSKSGYGRILNSAVYSDSVKNTKDIMSPCVTLLGEGTPEDFYNGLTVAQIKNGLIPRFSIIEVTSERPPSNYSYDKNDDSLARDLAELCVKASAIMENDTVINVERDNDAAKILDGFDKAIDLKINTAKEDAYAEIWARAFIKVLKVAGVLAVCVDSSKPVIDKEIATWAINFVVKEIKIIEDRLNEGCFGVIDAKQEYEVRRLFNEYLRSDNAFKIKYSIPAPLLKTKIVPYNYIKRRLSGVRAFSDAKQGATKALDECLNSMVKADILTRLDSQELAQRGIRLTCGYIIND